MKKKWIIITALTGLLLVGFASVGPIMSQVEIPSYQILSSEKNIETRRYAPTIIAEVEVKGLREIAIGDGFRLLADYIFGNNVAKQEIAMTAPVQQQSNQKIAMTAPVQQQLMGDAWKVSFVMPSQYSLDTLPKPNNSAVTLTTVPEQDFIVLTFSGRISNENIAKHEQQLIEYIQAHKIKVIGSPLYAFYNPPWTLPFLRRNEIMFEVKRDN